MEGSPTSPDHKTKRQSDPTPFGFKGSYFLFHTQGTRDIHC